MQADTLDVAALRALAGEAQVSLESAARLLQDSKAQAEDLSDPDLRPLWSVLADRLHRREALDFVAVREALKSSPRKVLEVALEVISNYELGRADERLALLHESGVRNRFVEGLRAAAVAAKAGAPLSDLERMAIEAGRGCQGRSRVRNCKGDAIAHMAHLENVWAGRSPPALATGWSDFDSVVALVPNLLVIGARPGVGKTAMVAGLVRQWTEAGARVGLISWEDTAPDLAARLEAYYAGVQLRYARGDVAAPEELRPAIQDGVERWGRIEHLLETDDARPAGAPADVIASMREMRRRGAAVCLLDNMSCVRFDGESDRFDLVIGQTLQDIRSEAIALHMPTFILGHFRRTADEDSRPPRLGDFSNASAWENFGRVILGMWSDADGLKLRVLKQTNGPAGMDFAVERTEQAAVVTGLARWAPAPKPPASPPKYTRRTPQEDA